MLNDELPGFRRRLRLTPGPGWVRAELEDDFHCMAVTLRHENGGVTAVHAEQDRAPWTTCSGAIAGAERTFGGARLDSLPRGREVRRTNCTHLYDLAVLAAAHARDAEPLTYDILVSDPVPHPAEERRLIELRRDGAPVMRWVEEEGRLSEPAEIAGLTLSDMDDWIAGLDPRGQECARLLRWGARIARGRLVPLEQQSDAARMPLVCYTFQPHVAVHARRVGEIRDFSAGSARPLDRRGVGGRL